MCWDWEVLKYAHFRIQFFNIRIYCQHPTATETKNSKGFSNKYFLKLDWLLSLIFISVQKQWKQSMYGEKFTVSVLMGRKKWTDFKNESLKFVKSTIFIQILGCGRIYYHSLALYESSYRVITTVSTQVC